jgi:hypothetical protein
MTARLKFLFSIVAVCLLTIPVSLAQDASIKGTPYMNDTYEQGVVFLEKSVIKVPARYNVFQDVMEYQQGGRAMVLDPSASIKKVKLQNTTFVVDKYVLDGKTKYGYLMLLDSGKAMLYARKVVKYLPPKKGANPDGTDQVAEFKRVPDVFYFKIGNNELQDIKNIKSMIAAFPDKQEELTRFAKQEKISPRNQDEVVKLVKYYNSL